MLEMGVEESQLLLCEEKQEQKQSCVCWWGQLHNQSSWVMGQAKPAASCYLLLPNCSLFPAPPEITSYISHKAFNCYLRG